MDDETSGVITPTVDLALAVDILWMFVCFLLVLLMQAGFACYEVGAIRAVSSTRPILLKNVGDSTVSLAAWCILGHTLAFGTDFSHVLGTSHFFTKENPAGEASEKDEVAVHFLEFLYRWAFAATCTTIVSGAVADRIPFEAYIVYSFLTSALFYPLLAHWVWAEEGWASSTRENQLLGCGVIDFSGSGVVHMCGGGIGHFIAKKVKSRPARFFEAKEYDRRSKLKNPTNCRQLNEAGFRQNDPAWMTLGCFLLWLGWYGFNCGSTFEISTIESQNAAGRAAINTTLGAAFGGIFSVCFEFAYHRWSPTYRKREDKIEDPLYEVDLDVDAGEEAGRADRERQERSQLRRETIMKIEKFKDEHPGSRHNPGGEPTPIPKWPDRRFKWPFSTHKNMHGAAINGILAGLVGMTAGCATMSHAWAVGVSLVSAFLYNFFHRRFMWSKTDDAVSAGAIHMVCGGWGLVAAGFTGLEAARLDAGYPSEESCSRGSQTLVNLAMTAFIVAYVMLCTWLLWIVLRVLKLVDLAQEGQVSVKAELEGITKLKDEIIVQGLEDNRLKTERDGKIDDDIGELVNRVEKLDVNRLNDVEASLTVRAQDFDALVERVHKLENLGRTAPPSRLRKTSSARPHVVPVADASQLEADESSPPPKASSKTECNVS